MLLSDKILRRFLTGICIAGLSFTCFNGHGYAAEGTAGTIVAETGDIGIVVERANIRNGERIYQCGYCGRFIDVGTIHSRAVHDMKQMLEEALASRDVGYREGKGKRRYINVLIYRFKEREGGNFVVEEPAGVGFHVHLLEGSDLKKVFVFDKDQKPLSENPLGVEQFVKRRGEWVTVDELAREGIQSAVKELINELP